jgi:tripartite-type tricarboxylate transporter receptor subunit TctC
MHHRLGIVLALVASALTGNAWGQSFPNRPIRLVVPFTAGGTVTINARIVASEMEQHLGQNIIVDNRAGANGIIGVEIVANAAPDGYTLLHHSTAIAISESVYKKLPYQLFRDLEPVTIIALGTGYVLIANTSFPAQTVRELIAAGKSRQVTYGSGGIGNSTQLVAEMFSKAAEVRMAHVPYKGVAPAITAVMSGEVNMMFIPPTAVVQHIKAGRVRALAFTGASRWSLLPDVPTIAESGLAGFHKDSGFNAWFAPAKTPASLIAKLQQEVHRALQVPKVREVFVAGAYEPVGNTPAEAKKYLRDQVKDYGDIVRAVGIEPN